MFATRPKRSPAPWLILCMAVICLWLPWLGLSPFSTRGEPREALVAQAMEQSGNFILPRVYSGAVPSKPPMLHWLMVSAASASGLGVTEFTARLPSALMATFAVLFFAWYVARNFGSSVGLWTGVILATNIEWWRAAMSARVDMLLAVLMLVILLSAHQVRRYSLRSGAALPLILAGSGAVLTKGPVGVCLPLLAVSVWRFLSSPREWYRIATWAAALVILSLIVPGVWYGAAYQQGGTDFITKVVSENLHRLSSTMEDAPHKHSFFYLIGVGVVGFLPWSILAMTQGFELKSFRRWWQTQSDPFVRFSWIVVATVTIFYAIPEGKRSVYLLPIYPFLSFLTARALTDNELSRLTLLTIRGMGLLLALVFSVAIIFPLFAVTSISGPAQDVLYYQQCLASLPLAVTVVMVLLLIGAIAVICYPMLARQRLWLMAIVWWVTLVALAGAIMPAFNIPLSEARLAADIRPLIGHDTQLYSYKRAFYGTSFYLKRPISNIEPGTIVSGLILVEHDDEPELVRNLAAAGDLVEIYRSSFGVSKPRDRIALYSYQPHVNHD